MTTEERLKALEAALRRERAVRNVLAACLVLLAVTGFSLFDTPGPRVGEAALTAQPPLEAGEDYVIYGMGKDGQTRRAWGAGRFVEQGPGGWIKMERPPGPAWINLEDVAVIERR